MSKAENKGFSFGIPATINGKVYMLDIGSERVAKISKGIKERMAAASVKADETGDITDMVDITRGYIDALCGDGSFETIFSGRNMNAFDLASLFRYIAATISSTRKAEGPKVIKK